MSTQEDKEMDLKTLLDQIDVAFARVQPTSVYNDILTQQDFDRLLAEEGFEHIQKYLYSYEEDEVHYLTPFLMRAYLDHYGENWEKDEDLSNYLFWFGHYQDEVDFIRNRYISFYSRFNDEQRKSICSFLRFLLKYRMDEGFIDEDVQNYWCGEMIKT